MNKKILYVGGGLIALALVAFIALQFFLGSIVTAGINKFAPRLTQTTVKLAGANISPLTGQGTLSGLVVGNPRGWSENNLCALGEIHLDVAPFSLFGDHIVVNEIEIEAPEFNYETKIVASNVKDLLKNIEQVTGSRDKAVAPVAKSGRPIKLEVKRFRLKNGKVRLSVGATVMTVPMPPIELAGLGTKEGGITPDQLVLAIMKDVTASIVGAAVQAAGQIDWTSKAAATEGIKKAGDAIKGLFGGEKKK
ncbi:MAG: hypothetical protein HY736_01155 [Verrucomicrobia bacterium]|nr:hypothetical protein [Verrucomicrobiota bacterium]